jgi:hypothetical protein
MMSSAKDADCQLRRILSLKSMTDIEDASESQAAFSAELVRPSPVFPPAASGPQLYWRAAAVTSMLHRMNRHTPTSTHHRPIAFDVDLPPSNARAHPTCPVGLWMQAETAVSPAPSTTHTPMRRLSSVHQPETPSLSPRRLEVSCETPRSPEKEDMLPCIDPHNPPEELIMAPRKRRAFQAFPEAYMARRVLDFSSCM